jgi:hypothetical protein
VRCRPGLQVATANDMQVATANDMQVATANDMQVATVNDMDASFMSLLLHERGIHALRAGRPDVARAHHRSQERSGIRTSTRTEAGIRSVMIN